MILSVEWGTLVSSKYNQLLAFRSGVYAQDRVKGPRRVDMKKIEAPVFDIQKFSVHDGPGIRTLVFMKGCPLYLI